MRICRRCLGIYKRSEEGKRARKNGGSWGRGRWPHAIYHTCDGNLCKLHQQEARSRLKDAYAERERSVIMAGFASYKSYLKSELWKQIRKNVFELFGDECHFCGSKATQVHHERYDKDTMRGKEIRYLYPVCADCHKAGEFFVNGEKCTPFMATRRMRELACMNGHGKQISRRQKERNEVIRPSDTT